MAPTPMTSSPAKGKARVYMCRPCGTRHVPPTGLNCRLQKQKQARASVVDSRRSPKKKTIMPNTTATRKVGRPRKSLPPPEAASSESETDDVPIEDILAPFSRPMLARPVPAPRGRRPTPPPRQSLSPRLLSPEPGPARLNRSGEDEPESIANASFRSDVSNRDLGLILDRISQLRADNAAEIRRVEQAADRERDREAHQREKAFLTDTIVAIQQSIASLKTSNAPDSRATPASLTADASSSQTGLAGPSSPTKTTSMSLPLLSGGAPPDMTLQGQPPTVDVTPEKLSASDHPIQFLRWNKPTSDVASIILQEVGLAKAIELDKAHKGKSSAKSANKLKARDVKWPNAYVYRLDVMRIPLTIR